MSGRMQRTAGQGHFIEAEGLGRAIAHDGLLQVPIREIAGRIDLVGSAGHGRHRHGEHGSIVRTQRTKYRGAAGRQSARDVFHAVAGAIAIGIRIGIKALPRKILQLPGIRDVVVIRIGFCC